MNTEQKSDEMANAGQNSVIKINPEYKLEKVASRPDQCRPNIQNIKLDKTARFGNCAVSTNGRSMAIVPIEALDGENDKGLISVEALKASRKNKPLEGRLILNGDIEIPGGAIMERPTGTDYGYPNWEQVLPRLNEHKPTLEIGLNAKLLLELCQALGAGDEIVRLQFVDALTPVVVTRCNNRSNGEYGVLMPGRVTS